MLLLGVDGETVGVVGVHQIGSHRVYSSSQRQKAYHR